MTTTETLTLAFQAADGYRATFALGFHYDGSPVVTCDWSAGSAENPLHGFGRGSDLAEVLTKIVEDLLADPNVSVPTKDRIENTLNAGRLYVSWPGETAPKGCPPSIVSYPPSTIRPLGSGPGLGYEHPLPLVAQAETADDVNPCGQTCGTCPAADGCGEFEVDPAEVRAFVDAALPSVAIDHEAILRQMVREAEDLGLYDLDNGEAAIRREREACAADEAEKHGGPA